MFHIPAPPRIGPFRLPPPPPLPVPGLARGAGLAALSALLSRLLRSTSARHPSVLRRMGAAAGARICLDVADMPMLLLMEPALGRIRAFPRAAPPASDAVIRGRLPAFLSMLHGAEDGDALFFSGDLAIEGDTGAVLALRNALDDAELDLTEELASLAPRLGPALRRLSTIAERRTGWVLSRAEMAGAGGMLAP